MESEKPKIAPRPSLKKPEAGDILPVPETKPLPKPKPPVKPRNVSSTNPEPIKAEIKSEVPQTKPEKAVTQNKDDTEIRDLSVRITNKLKISAGDLAKLRSRSNWNESSQQSDNKLQIYDVREDEEQIRKMEEISELLIVAGYFRARIKGLHNFDKIIGGMCWNIQMCNVDLDIDVFYQDSLSIGQKIALTEKIVRVLQRMKCPHKLEPHQIQGMDCIHIFPVIQWLIKRSLETRQANADIIRAFASWQFTRSTRHGRPLHSDSVLFNNCDIAQMSVNPIKAGLERKFVHPSRDTIKDQDMRSRTTMLEYGVLGLGQNQRTISADDKMTTTAGSNKPATLELPVDGSKKRSESDSAAVENLLSVMSEADMRVDTSLIGNILSEQSTEIRRLAKEYEKSSIEELSMEQQFRRREAKLKSMISSKIAHLNALKEKEDISTKLETIKAKIEAVNEKLSQTEQLDERTVNQRLQSSEILNMLRKQKTDFKHHCREEQKRLEMEIEALKKSKVSDSPAKSANLVNELSKLEARHDGLKKELADVTKQHVTLVRKFSEIPTRTELAQYQKRFIELYNQLSTKHNETKKFYTMFNVLADQRMYLEKEFNLINSILENFQTAQHSSNSVKEEFLVKLEQIVESIVQNKNNVEQKLVIERRKRDQLNTQHIDLMEQQRQYFKAVKLFKEECARNESLIAALES